MISRPARLLTIFAVLLPCSIGVSRAGEDDGWQRAVRALAPSDQITATEMAFLRNGRIEGSDTPCRNDVVVRLRCVSADGNPVWDSVVTTGVGGTSPDPDVRCLSPLARVREAGVLFIPTMGLTPLSAGEQKRVRAKDTGETRTIDGRRCRVHAFKWRQTRPERGRASGTACLDEETGLPLVVKYEPQDPPKGIRRVSCVTRYGPVLEDRWAIVGGEIDIWIEGAGGDDSTAHMILQMSGHAAAADLARPGACEK